MFYQYSFVGFYAGVNIPQWKDIEHMYVYIYIYKIYIYIDL